MCFGCGADNTSLSFNESSGQVARALGFQEETMSSAAKKNDSQANEKPSLSLSLAKIDLVLGFLTRPQENPKYPFRPFYGPYRLKTHPICAATCNGWLIWVSCIRVSSRRLECAAKGNTV